jgi:hypothetical protein
MKTLIKTKELKLADMVSLFPDDPFSTAIVKQIKDGWITLFRPYGTTADFSYTGGVITYIGVEDFTIQADDRMITLYERKKLK